MNRFELISFSIYTLIFTILLNTPKGIFVNKKMRKQMVRNTFRILRSVGRTLFAAGLWPYYFFRVQGVQHLFNFQKLDFKYQRGVRWNDLSGSFCAIS